VNTSPTPQIEQSVARSCAVDVTTALRPGYGAAGIGRVVIEVARALHAAGGRVIWMEPAKRRLYEIDREAFAEHCGREVWKPWRLGTPDWLLGHQVAAVSYAMRLRKFRRFSRPFVPADGDVLLLFGAYWGRAELAALRALAQPHGVRLVSLVYDLIPIRRPELCGNTQQYLSLFREYLRTITTVSDRILACSASTREDLLRFCQEDGRAAPATVAVPLASNFDQYAVPRLTPRLAAENLSPRSFALMVSNFEPRKNHDFAYHLWRRMVERLGSRAIPLVFAGQRGWLTDDLFALLKNDRQMWQRHIRFIEGPSDEELAWLYSHAGFTLFPSQFEGWGLPITESLSFGTYCLAADNTSLREASQDLAWHGDTLDGVAWLEEVERCILDPAHMDRKRAQIAARFVKRRWTDFLADVLREVEATTAR
jgi:glycosyltransferase involved in cell wall biosynthesis